MADFICSVCGLLSDKWEKFPNSTCKDCHAKINDSEPVDKPDFIGTIQR